jgi:hypothetical protein
VRLAATALAGVALALAAALAGAAAASVAAPSTSGNAAAIAYDRAAVRAEDHAPGYEWTEHGYITIRSRASSGRPAFAWEWSGLGNVAAGWAPVSEQGTVAFRGNGDVAWIIDELYPHCGATIDCTPNVPMQVIVTKAGMYVRQVGRNCSYRFAGGVPWSGLPGTGAPWFYALGDFAAPPRHAGPDTELTYTYLLGGADAARETDSFVTATKAISHAAIIVSAGRRLDALHPANRISYNYTPLAHTPPAPAVTVCR